jgi:hypothetical protein
VYQTIEDAILFPNKFDRHGLQSIAARHEKLAGFQLRRSSRTLSELIQRRLFVPRVEANPGLKFANAGGAQPNGAPAVRVNRERYRDATMVVRRLGRRLSSYHCASEREFPNRNGLRLDFNHSLKHYMDRQSP